MALVSPLPTSPTFHVSGQVTGLTGQVRLKLNGAERVSVTGSGTPVPFSFSTDLNTLATYRVQVDGEPSNVDCTVTNGQGTILGADVANVLVTCAAQTAPFQVAVGANATCVLDRQGFVECFGSDAVIVDNEPTGVFVKLTMSHNSACALRADGTHACWGNNLQTKLDRVPAVPLDDVDISDNGGCAIRRADKTMFCWGNIGSQSSTATHKKVSATYVGACEIMPDDTLRCFGVSGMPASLTTEPTGTFKEVAGGYHHACALRTTGAIDCWGVNDYLQANDPQGTDFIDVTAGAYHSCGLRADGTVTCWGAGTSRYFSDAIHRGQAAPPSAAEDGVFVDIAAGENHTCAIRADGRVLCWGDVTQEHTLPPFSCGDGYQDPGESCDDGNTADGDGCAADCMTEERCGDAVLGLGEVCDDASNAGGVDRCNDSCDVSSACVAGQTAAQQCDDANDCTAPVACDVHLGCIEEPVEDGEPCDGGAGQCALGTCIYPSVKAATVDTCALMPDGSLTCFGAGLPTSKKPEGRFSFVDVDATSACAITLDGAIQCWGTGPAAPQALAYQVVRNGSFGCYIQRPARSVHCFGNESNGRISGTPTSGQFNSVAVTVAAACAVRVDGSIQCWGYNLNNQASPPSGNDFIAVDAGQGREYFCGLHASGEIECWGDNGAGSGDFPGWLRPPPATDFVSMSAGLYHGCGTHADGRVSCWGAREGFMSRGQVDGPSLALPEGSFVTVAAAVDHSCAQRADGRVHCWGEDGLVAAEPPLNCGDGIRNAGESCDDGNNLSSDGCDSTCQAREECGDGMLSVGELCDDGQNAGGTDFCSDDCSTSTKCSAGSCEAATECTTPAGCDPQLGCLTTPLADGTSCNAGKGECVSGECVVPSVEAGPTTTCAIDHQGQVHCFGTDAVLVNNVPAGTFSEIRVGTSMACAWGETQRLRCWSSNTWANGRPDSLVRDVAIGSVSAYFVAENDGYMSHFVNSGGLGASVVPDVEMLDLDVMGQRGCAIKADRTLACFNPVGTFPSGTFLQIDAGTEHMCGIRTDGSLECWGTELHGRMAKPAGNDYVDVTAGTNHSCALRSNGRAVCWGSLPEAPTGPEARFVDIAAGADHTCGMRSDGRLICWGPGLGSYNAPTVACGNGTVEPGESCDDGNLISGDGCALDCKSRELCGNGVADLAEVCDDGGATGSDPENLCSDDCNTSHVSCTIGAPAAGQCDDGNECTVPSVCDPQRGCVEAPKADGSECASGRGNCVSGQCVLPQVSSAKTTTCYLDAAAQLKCFGSNESNGPMTGLPSGQFKELAVGAYDGCAIALDGRLACWSGSTAPALYASTVATAMYHAQGCALRKVDGKPFCWGTTTTATGSYKDVALAGSYECFLAQDGVLSCPGATGSWLPPTGTFSEVAGGGEHFCALRTSGSIDCWGSEAYYGTQDEPTDTDFVQVVAGHLHACGLHSDGTVTCWGAGDAAHARDTGLNKGQALPPAAPLGVFSRISAGPYHTCGIKRDGQVLCWGDTTKAYSTPPVNCGNGVQEAGEACDDGNRIAGDGCSAMCLSEEWCGNGQRDVGETCDDARNAGDDDFCDDQCQTSSQCAAGVPLAEQCDDDNECTQPTVCDPQEGCIEDPVVDGTGCESGRGRCLDGTCIVPQVAAGDAFTCATGFDGQIRCFGTITSSGSVTNPAVIPAGVFTNLYAGNNNMCASKADGAVLCWGGGAAGNSAKSEWLAQDMSLSGAGCIVRKHDNKLTCWSPAGAIADRPGPYKRIANANSILCAITTSNAIECLSNNVGGEEEPTGSDFVDLAGGLSHMCALRTNGSIVCWGSNLYGQSNDPPDTDFVAVTAGKYNSCGLRANGTVKCWGLGDERHGVTGLATKQSVPPKPPLGLFVSIASGEKHMCGARADGRVLCWGDTSAAHTQPPVQCGDGLQQPGEACDDGNLSSGDGCAANCLSEEWCGNGIRDVGETCDDAQNVGGPDFCSSSCQSSNLCSGTCDDGNPCTAPSGCDAQTGCSEAPVADGTSCGTNSVCAAGTCVKPQAVAGDKASCGIDATGTIRCWGSDTLLSGAANIPAGRFTRLELYRKTACAMAADGTFKCWGTAINTAPLWTAKDVATSDDTGCIVRAYDNQLLCWGSNGSSAATPPTGTFSALSLTINTGCAINSMGAIECWGSASPTGIKSPPAAGTGNVFIDIVGGNDHFCAIRAASGAGAGNIACWGGNTYGQTTSGNIPAGNDFVTLSAGTYHTCGLRQNGAVACWGRNDGGQLTLPSGGGPYVDVGGGLLNSCASYADGRVQCWGGNADNQSVGYTP
jgi:cysteine-rich repeat protein